MAKVNIEFDTVDKTMSVNVDGAVVDNVVEAYVARKYSYDEEDDVEYSCSVTTSVKDEESYIHTITRLAASESTEGKAAASQGAAPALVDGFLVVSSTSKVHEDIASYLSGR